MQHPRWSPDSSQVLFQTNFAALGLSEKFWLVGLGGDAPREVFSGWQILEAPQMQPERLSAAWHPDGRISIWASPTGSRTYSPTFWTVPISGGTPSRLEIAPELVEQFKGISSGPFPEPSQDFKFSWAPSGKAIYFERTFRGAQNIWRMNIDPRTLRAVGIERLTTGTGFDAESSVSSDGKKLAFTGESRHVRVWLFPFDAKLGRISGAGQPVTSAEIESWGQEISRDGTKLIFRGTRGGKIQLWEKSLVNGREAPIIAEDSYGRASPQWSPDGSKLAYIRFKPITKTSQLVIWSSRNRSEEPITTIGFQPYDWSPDSKWLLASWTDPETGLTEIWQVPAASSPHAARKLVSDPSYEFYQAHFSPDGRWIVFEAVTFPSNSNSSLYVIPASGGPRIPITKGHPWDDKPRWSPDGQMIYYLSLQKGLFNVSGIHFDPAMGKPIGEPFRVTSFQYPGPVFANRIMSGQLSLTEDKLVLTMEDRSGGIWMLDNVDR